MHPINIVRTGHQPLWICSHRKGIVDMTEKNKNCLYLHGAPNSGKSLIALSIGLTFKKFIDIGNSASIFKLQSAVIRDVYYLKK